MENKISANELRIGSWIKWVSVPVKFSGTACYGEGEWQTENKRLVPLVDYTSFKHFPFYQVAWEDLKPIPLTSELLEKCGFVTSFIDNPFFNGYSIDAGRHRQISVMNVGTPNEMVFFSQLDHHHSEVKETLVVRNLDYDGKTYLHQLQNLYFSLTGKELEIKL